MSFKLSSFFKSFIFLRGFNLSPGVLPFVRSFAFGQEFRLSSGVSPFVRRFRLSPVTKTTSLNNYSPKTIRNILVNSTPDSEVEVYGWVRSVRVQKNVSFAAINDGSSLKGMQVILTSEEANKLKTGACVRIRGILTQSPGTEQSKELQAQQVEVLGESDSTYPLQKKYHSMEFLRDNLHLRSRTNLFGAIFRVRSAAIIGFQNFFQTNEFFQIHTPIITNSDCEGGGEVFKISANKKKNIKIEHTKDGLVEKDFFGSPVYLTVSGQLHAEILACAMSRVYTFGPVFRAEESLTSRHLAEFWMLEAEIAFMFNLDELLDFAESCLRETTKHILNTCSQDLEFFNQWVDEELSTRLESTTNKPFIRITYSEAINILSKANKKFEFQPVFGTSFHSEHEKYLATDYCRGPVFITDYPKEIKPFYMRVNPDGKTVACTDLLFPKVGEIVGGSLREERYQKLVKRLEEFNLNTEEFQWYLDLRKYGTIPHGGFGIGFERYLQYITGMDNIRDVIPFPRSTNFCKV
ncbi:asparaginyl-tRNA synthetase [Gigaspora rosea]|uniref:Asparagine--tRNA ligase, mitochondrial n=1 Tax=Gigaspora rosea TaxID=44941 RepID=A0A397UT50_9GLOM|nr:asparaginyl-tRNA synthetase [Gigaspora rosea]